MVFGRTLVCSFEHGFFAIIGGTPGKRISEGLFCRLLFCWLWVFIGIIGGTPDKRICEGLVRRCFFFPVCLVCIGVIGGTPDKRISEGLFCPLFFWLGLGFYRHYRGDP